MIEDAVIIVCSILIIVASGVGLVALRQGALKAAR
jgi:hypothetical protein